MVDRQGPGNGILGQVGVLVLVDQYEAIAVIQGTADFRMVAEQSGHVEQ